MTQTCASLNQRLLYIFHLAFVDIRNLAYAGHHAQVADLADAMETLPRLISQDGTGERDLETIRLVIQKYMDQHPENSRNYLAFLEERDPPERY